MYAKIPFASGWSAAQVMSVLSSLFEGTTNPALLPAGITASATIDNTVPHGWTKLASAGSLILCHAPITGRTDKRKHIMVYNTTTLINMAVGDNITSSQVYLNGAVVGSPSARLLSTTSVPTSSAMQVHVFITPERFMFALERLSSVTPITSTNQNYQVGGVVDLNYGDEPLYGNGGKFLPIGIMSDVENTTSAPTMPLVSQIPTPLSPIITFPSCQFVLAGTKLTNLKVPADGKLYRAGGSTVNHVYEVGISAKADDPVTGIWRNLLVAHSSFATPLQEHTVNSKQYMTFSVGVSNGANATTLFIPKE